MASRNPRSFGAPDRPRTRPLRPKLDPRLNMLLGLGRAAVLSLRKHEHGQLRAHALELGEAARKLRVALQHEDRPERRQKLEQEFLGPIRARQVNPLTAGIRFPNQQHDLPSTLRLREPLLSVIVHSRLSNGELEELGFVVRSRVGDWCTAWVGWSKVASAALDKREKILSIDLARATVQHADDALDYTGLTAMHNAFTGAGVLIGVADSYIDFHHPAFQETHAGGPPTTRILSIWAQGLAEIANPLSPAQRSKGTSLESELAGLIEGVEYTRGQIDQTLANAANGKNPYSPVDHEPPASPTDGDLHGTQVAGAALGRDPGNAPPHYGAAPDAELIFVHLRDEMSLDVWKRARAKPQNQGRIPDLPALGMVDSAALIDACTYIFARADEADKPCVVCLSRGDALGPHDGTSALEQFLDESLKVPKRVIVVSAGNEQGNQCHTSGSIAPAAAGGSADIDILIGANAQVAEEIQVWFDQADVLQVTVEHRVQLAAPHSTLLANAAGPDPLSSSLAGIANVVVQLRCPEASGSSSVTVLLLPESAGASLAAGIYRIHVVATAFVGGKYQAWISRSNAGSHFLNPDPSQQSITTPATATNVIAVGAHGLYNTMGLIQPPPSVYIRSGIGPSRDGREKPDLCAPTGFMTPAYAGRIALGPQPTHTYLSFGGTSAAAPVVAGAAAVAIEMQMQQQPSTVPDCASVLQDLLNATNQQVQQPVATGQPQPGICEPKVWGAGWLDFSNVALPAVAPMVAPVIMPTPPPQFPERQIPVALDWKTKRGGIEVRAVSPPEEIDRLVVDLPLESVSFRSADAARLLGTRQNLGGKKVAELLDVSGAASAEVVDRRVLIRARGAFLRLPRLNFEGGLAPALTVTVRAAARSRRRPEVRVLQFESGHPAKVNVH